MSNASDPNTPNFKDLFSTQAGDYARFRPTYPKALFQYLSSLVTRHEQAWDCGTGNGQAAVLLAEQFQKIVATDPSAKQIAEAEPRPNIEYRIATAEASGLPSHSVTLVTAAQAFHWFRHADFFTEVSRVARPGESVLAYWCYNVPRITPRIDAELDTFYRDVVGPYWEPERRLVETEYATIPLPFPEIAAPSFTIESNWSLPHFLGYLGTWSATQKARKALGTDPVAEFAPRFEAAWEETPLCEKKITTKLGLRVGRV